MRRRELFTELKRCFGTFFRIRIILTEIFVRITVFKALIHWSFGHSILLVLNVL